MTREHWNQAAFIVAIIVAIGGAEWTIQRSYAALDSRVSADERDLQLLRTEVDQLRLDQTKRAAEESAANLQFASQLAVLQATWDLLKDQDRFRHSR